MIFFKQTDQPWVRKGNIACAAFIAAEVGAILAILFLSKRDEARKRKRLECESSEDEAGVARLGRTGGYEEDGEDWDKK